ncbi:MAG: hypothetical protein U0350_18655 [Caldilineaceae bacterium]
MFTKRSAQVALLGCFTALLCALFSVGVVAGSSSKLGQSAMRTGPASVNATPTATPLPVPNCNDFAPFVQSNFTDPVHITNQWLPLKPGMQYTLKGVANRTGQLQAHEVIFTVTDVTKVINGVRNIVVWDRDIDTNQIQEAELAFFAQDKDGNVWATGEYPEEYTNGKFTGAPATWIAGLKGAKAGVSMLGNPQLGSPSYSQAYAPPDIIYDCGQVFATAQTITVPSGLYQNVMIIDEWSPFDPPGGHQRKYHAPGIGVAQVGAVDDPEGETLVLLSAVHLDAAAAAAASAEALKLDTHAYKVSSVYKQTAVAARSPELLQYALTVNTVGNGTVALNPPGGVYAPGTVVQLSATPAADTIFSGWSGVTTAVTNPLTITISGDHIVTATFAAAPPPLKHTLTVNTVGKGAVTLNPPDGTYVTGTVVQLSAAPETGYTFSHWGGAVSGATNPITLTLTSDQVVTATFTIIPTKTFTLTVTKVGNGTIVLDPPGGVYPVGTVVKLHIIPDPGFKFDGWRGDLTGLTDTVNVTMDGNKQLTATFVPDVAPPKSVYLPLVLR